MNAIQKMLQSDATPTRKEQISIVCALAWPSIVEQILLTMVQYINTAMVGSLGSNATAAIGLMATTTWLFNGFLSAVGVGFAVQVAHHIGAGNLEDAKSVVRQAVLFNLYFGLFMGACAVGLSFILPGLLGASPEIGPTAGLYFRIVGLSIPFLLSSTLFGSIIRCTGDTKTPMLLNMLINVLDVLFNSVLIFPTRTVHLGSFSFTVWGANLGVPGAATGTALATVIVSGLFLLVIFKKQSIIRISFQESFRFTKGCLATAAHLGIPVALERSTICIAQIVITMIISHLGTVAIAANYLATTAEGLSYLPAYGIAAAATTLIGQSIGAKKKNLALQFSRISVCMGMLFMTATGFLLYFFAPQLISIFSHEPQVIALGANVLRVEAFAQPLFAASIVATGVLRGAGDSRGPFLINLVSMWGVRLVIASIIAPHVGLIGVWIAMCTELCVRGLIFLARLHTKKWLETEGITA